MKLAELLSISEPRPISEWRNISNLVEQPIGPRVAACGFHRWPVRLVISFWGDILFAVKDRLSVCLALISGGKYDGKG